MANPETNLMNKIMLAVSDAGHTPFRNNVGAYKTDAGHYVRFGVGGKGGSDLVGITKGGKFFALEVKTAKGRPTKEQIAFINHVNSVGGVAAIVRSPEDALILLAGK